MEVLSKMEQVIDEKEKLSKAKSEFITYAQLIIYRYRQQHDEMKSMGCDCLFCIDARSWLAALKQTPFHKDPVDIMLKGV